MKICLKSLLLLKIELIARKLFKNYLNQTKKYINYISLHFYYFYLKKFISICFILLKDKYKNHFCRYFLRNTKTMTITTPIRQVNHTTNMYRCFNYWLVKSKAKSTITNISRLGMKNIIK